MKTIIFIPARMASVRFPNKPMANIAGIPMIERVWRQAIDSNVGNVYVACSEKEVFELINDIGGKAIMTDPKIPSGTDRIYAALQEIPDSNEFDNIINLQGDMPLIRPTDIIKVNQPILNGYSIGTLATNLSNIEEKNNNITKVEISWNQENILGESIDFYKTSKGITNNIFHHVGIYSFKRTALYKFVKLAPSKNEIDRKLEQMRALDSGIKIGISFVENAPISVDTKEDLIQIESIIRRYNDKY